MTINKIKKILRKEYEVLNESIRFQGVRGNKLYCKLNSKSIYWRLEKKGEDDYLLSHTWYYPVE